MSVGYLERLTHSAFVEHFTHSVEDMFHLSYSEDGLWHTAAKITLIFSTFLLLGFVYHAGYAAYTTYFQPSVIQEQDTHNAIQNVTIASGAQLQNSEQVIVIQEQDTHHAIQEVTIESDAQLQNSGQVIVIQEQDTHHAIQEVTIESDAQLQNSGQVIVIQEHNAHHTVQEMNIASSLNLKNTGKGTYGQFQRTASTVLSVSTGRPGDKGVLSVVVQTHNNGTMTLANRNSGGKEHTPLCNDLYNQLHFENIPRIAMHLAYEPLIWEAPTHMLRYPPLQFANRTTEFLYTLEVIPNAPARNLPTDTFILAKTDDLLIQWPTQENPQGSIIRKTRDFDERISVNNMHELRSSSLSIEDLEQDNRSAPSIILTAFIELWKARAAQIQM